MATILKELFTGFTLRVFYRRLAICVCSSFPFGFEGMMRDLIA